MLFRPDTRDYRLIGFYVGKVLVGVGLAMVIPACLGFLVGEDNEAWAFVVGAALAVIFGYGLQRLCRTRWELTVTHGLAAAATAWLLAAWFGAVPLVLSGHYEGFLDAYFEAMSGFATIGLTLAQDLDHMALSVNLWRHLMQFMGGQGIIIIALTIFSSAGGAIGSLYMGEGREETILPNVVNTARFIWRVTLSYGLVGVTLLWATLTLHAGLPPLRGLYHAASLFMAAFDTGGFAVQSSSVAFYRSFAVELVLLPVMLAGAFSFALHYQLWQRNGAELVRNLEARVLAVSTPLLLVGMGGALLAVGWLSGGSLVRHTLFHTVSAHTTTGLATMPGTLYTSAWGVLAPATLVIGMALGGMAGSTAGGIKALRIGIVYKALRRDVRRILSSENAVVIEHYHLGHRRVLQDRQITSAVVVFLLWVALYGVGAVVALFYGYDIQTALFDSTAAASSGGLSVGLARPEMEPLLKVTFIAQMLLGRLEFIAVFALIGYLVSIVRGRA